MVTIDTAKKKILSEYSDGKITIALESPGFFIFEVIPKNSKGGDYTDSLVGVDKKSGKMDTYHPFMHGDDFKKARVVE